MEERKFKLSFLQRQHVDITVLKMFSPSRFIVKEAPSICGSEEAKAFTNLEEAMDMYYKTYQMEVNELPCSGSIVAVCPDRRNWYRAKVESILESTVGPRVLAYLLDYGKTVSVEKFYVRKPFPRLHEVPFQALEFQLYGIVPCSLIMQPDCLMAYGPAEQWDIAAEEFVKAVVSSKRCAQMNVVHVDVNGILYGDLQVSIDEEFVSLSKELLSNQFASAVTKVESLNQTPETKGKIHCPNSNVTIEAYCAARKLRIANQKKLLEAAKAQVNKENEHQIVAEFKHASQAKSVSSRQAVLLKKLQCHRIKLQTLEHKTLNQKEVHEPVLELNENEEYCTAKNPMKHNFTNIKESEVFSAMNRDSNAIFSNNALQSVKEKSDIKSEHHTDVTSSKQSFHQTASFKPSSSNTMGVKLLQRLQAKLHCFHDNTNKQYTKLISNDNFIEHESPENEKLKDLTNKTTPVLKMNYKQQDFQVDCASGMVDTLNSSAASQHFAEKRVENCPGKLHHLQLLLQKTQWRTKQELQCIDCQVEKSSENKPDHFNAAIHQSESNKDCKSLKTTPDTSDTAIFPKCESYLPSSNEHSLYKIKGLERKTSHHSSQLVLKSRSSAEGHIFNKILDRLTNSPKEASEIEKSFSVNKEENLVTNCENHMSPALFNMDRETDKNNLNTSPNLPHLIMSTQFEHQNSSSSRTDPSLTNSAFTVNRIKLIKELQQSGEISKKQATIPDSVMILPKNMHINAHFKTIVDKWEDTLWDSNKMNRIICYGKGKPRPITTIVSAGFSTFIVQSLREMHFPGPLPVQTMMWPSILRGRSVVSIAPAHTGKTFGYLLPLISHISEPSLYEGLPTTGGPVALILCSSWKKAQNLHDHCRILLDKCNQVKVLVTYGGGCEKLQMMPLINGCDILIATPSSLLRLLQNDEYRVVDLKRCCHLIIDDGDVLLEVFKEEILDILKEYGICLQNRKHLTVPNQIIVCCERWKNGISSFAHNCMPDSLTFIASPFEAAVYARVFTYCHFISKQQSYSVLANIIDGCNGQRIVICTSDDINAKKIYQVLQKMSVYAILILSLTLHYEVNSLINEWNSMISPDTVHVLVTTDDILLDTSISNANYLIQCNLESTSRINFGLRYSCLMDNYSSIEKIQKGVSNCACHLLLTEDCVNIAPALVNLLQQLPLKIPQKLRLMAEERKKQLQASRSNICYYLKAYGHCPYESMCKERHTVSKELNRIIAMPKSGQVRVLVCYVIDATHYYVRIIEHNDPSSNCTLCPSSYLDINLKLMEYYNIKDNCIAEDEIEVDKICVVERPGSTYHRVRIEEIVNYNSLGVPRRVKIHYLDEGWQEVDDAQKLRKISSELAAYPVQVVEVYICRVQPIDKCYEWTPQASTYVHNMIGGKEMTGKIILTLGHTMWLEPFVHYVQIDKSDIVIRESNVRTALIKEGFAMANGSHIANLYALCDGIITLPPNNPETKPVVNSNIQQAFLELNKEHHVYVYAIQSPDIFFIQRYDRVDLIDNIQKELQELYKKRKLKKLENPQKGMICIAPFNEDNNYYRARIEEVHTSKNGDGSDEVSLFFVDFGDRDVARKKDLYCIPQECLLLPFQAIECSLGGICAPHGGWSDDINSVFDSLTVTADDVRKPLFLKALKKEPSACTGGYHYVVKLWEESSESCSLSEVLVNQGMAISTNLPTLSETTEETIMPDDDLTDEETEMAFAFYGAIGVKNSLELSKKKLKSPLNKVQNNIDRKYVDSMQKQAFALSSNYNDIPPLEKHSIGYTIPQVLWWQKKDIVKISIHLIGVKKFDTIFEEKHILFTTTINGKLYRFEEDLFDSVDSERSKKSIVGPYVELTLIKLNVGIKWPQLTASSKKRSYIRANFDYLDDSSSDEDVIKPSNVIKADPKDIIHFEPSDVEYSTDDEREWTDIHYNDNFYQV